MSRRSRQLIEGLEATGVHALLRRALRWRGVVVICHHRIGSPADTLGDPALFSATPDELDRQVRALRRHADLIAPEDLEDAARAGKGRCALITFDDGYRDLHDVALPVLAANGARAAMFVASSFVDRPRMPVWDELHWMAREAGREGEARGWIEQAKRRDPRGMQRLLDAVAAETGTGRAPAGLAAEEWCTWDQVRALRDAGMAIGGHTDTHPVLAYCPRAEQEREIRRGLDRLEAELGARPTLFAYPVGGRDAFDATTRSAVRDAGLRVAYSFYGGANPWTAWDPLDVRRIWPQPPPELLGIKVGLPPVYVRGPAGPEPGTAEAAPGTAEAEPGTAEPEPGTALAPGRAAPAPGTAEAPVSAGPAGRSGRFRRPAAGRAGAPPAAPGRRQR